jgi:hypothetical protein
VLTLCRPGSGGMETEARMIAIVSDP